MGGGLFSIFHIKSASKAPKTGDFAYFTSQWGGLEPPCPHLATLLAISINYCIISRIVLPYKSIHNTRDIFCDEMVLIFFMNTIEKPHVKRVTDEHFYMLIIFVMQDFVMQDAIAINDDEMVLKIFINTTAKLHVKRLTVELLHQTARFLKKNVDLTMDPTITCT